MKPLENDLISPEKPKFTGTLQSIFYNCKDCYENYIEGTNNV